MNGRWFRPDSLHEAITIRAEHRAIPLAGATDLYVRHRGNTGTIPQLPGDILYLGHLPELTGIISEAGELRIGAAAVYSDIAAHRDTPEVLKRTIVELAAPALRNTGTLGGNIGNASPAADAVCTLYALDASVELTSPGGTRRVALDAFITGPGKTTLADDELITMIMIPLHRYHLSYYRKVGTRRANALSKLSVAACATVENGRLKRIGIGLGAVAPTVVRSHALENRLVDLDAATLATERQDFLEGYRALVTPIDDQRSTAKYRALVAMNLLEELIDHAIPRALSGDT